MMCLGLVVAGKATDTHCHRSREQLTSTTVGTKNTLPPTKKTKSFPEVYCDSYCDIVTARLGI